LYANFTALSSIRPKLLPIEVFYCVNKEFRLFIAKKWLKILNFSFVPPN